LALGSPVTSDPVEDAQIENICCPLLLIISGEGPPCGPLPLKVSKKTSFILSTGNWSLQIYHYLLSFSIVKE